MPGIVVFTDGSKENRVNGEAGAGIAFYTAGEPVRVAGQTLIHSFKLEKKNSVFQTEVWAVRNACEILLENIDNDPPLGQIWVRTGWEVTFYSDSQSTLKALEAVIVKTPLVQETVTVLNKLASKLKSLKIRWVRISFLKIMLRSDYRGKI